ncbi:MAG TPA: tetratricopeptide repeat protein [Candidatus Ozemobacteraceae bacterium]|nr:tetratricopeptide repeat protein [Candidatus Ozemobacteraceae bacterium]
MNHERNNRFSRAGALLLPAALAVCLGFAVPGPLSAGPAATESMERAIKQRSAGDLDGAIRNLRKAVDASEVAAQRSLASFMLGDCLIESRKHAEAVEIYRGILERQPADEERAEALFRLAQCRQALGDHAGVKKLCRQIAADHGDTAYAELARLLLKSSEAARAAEPTEPPAESGEATAVAATPAEPVAAAPVPGPAPAARPPARTTRPVPQYEGVDPETVAAAQAKAAPEAVQPTTPVREPVRRPAVEPRTAAPAPAPVAPAPAASPAKPVAAPAKPIAQPAVSAQPKRPAPKAASNEEEEAPVEAQAPTAPARPARSAAVPDVSDLLTLPPLSSDEREALATQILHDQEKIKADPSSAGSDEVLMRIAEATARFGEPVEACKTYDRVLTGFPKSKHIERAYFEAIRLRAVIGLRPAVAQWGEVFLRSFPKSRRTGDVQRLITWARNAPSPAKKAATAGAGPARSAKAGGAGSERATKGEFDPESDPRFRQAKRRIADNRFALAMNDFQVLTDAHPDVPVLWWELALVQIQLQQYDEAEKSLDRLLSLQPDNQDARSLLGYVHYHQKDYNQAAADYRQAGATESEGLKFFDSQTAARRMERSSKKSKPSSTREGGNE